MTGWTIDLDDSTVKAHLEAAADEAATLMGEHILQVANGHVPIEEGTLERSGRVSDPTDGAVTVFYDTPYAVVQHEDMTFRHDAGRNAKWLENALNSERSTCAEIARRQMMLP
jgi:hypothetical protein